MGPVDESTAEETIDELVVKSVGQMMQVHWHYIDADV